MVHAIGSPPAKAPVGLSKGNSPHTAATYSVQDGTGGHLWDGKQLVHEDERRPADAGQCGEAAGAGACQGTGREQQRRRYRPLPGLLRGGPLQQRCCLSLHDSTCNLDFCTG